MARSSGAQREAARATRSSGRAARGGKSGAKRNATMWGWGCIKRREMGCKELPRCLDKMRREAGDSKSGEKQRRAAGDSKSGEKQRAAGDSKSGAKQRRAAGGRRKAGARDNFS